MPNWAYGPTDVTGTQKAIASFLNRFIYPDEPETINGAKYFARSFLHEDRADIRAELDALFQGVPEAEEREMRIYPDFAWSASSCIVSGYPENFPDTCITLPNACVEDQVDVVICTKEDGMWFEEEVICDRSGILTYDCKSLNTVRCRKCGNTQSIASFEDPGDLECFECGDLGLETNGEPEVS